MPSNNALGWASADMLSPDHGYYDFRNWVVIFCTVKFEDIGQHYQNLNVYESTASLDRWGKATMMMPSVLTYTNINRSSGKILVNKSTCRQVIRIPTFMHVCVLNTHSLLGHWSSPERELLPACTFECLYLTYLALLPDEFDISKFFCQVNITCFC